MKKSNNHSIYGHFCFYKKSQSNNNGITLIALVITIIVLLILAGVTINAITGSENAMEKGKEAREKNEQGEELEQIKLITTNAIANGLTGKVEANTLKIQLEGIVEESGRISITATNSPWIVKGLKTGNYYTISESGQVEAIDGVAFTNKNVKVKQGKSTEIEVINVTGEELTLSPTNSNGITITKGENNKVTISSAANAEIGTKITVTATAGTESDTCEIEVIDSPKRGDYIILNSRAITGVGPANTDNTSNTSNADDWMILYNGMDETSDNDKKGLFIIMSNYLPNAYKASDDDAYGVAKMAGLSYATGDYATYGVKGSSGLNLLNTLKPTDNNSTTAIAWKSLISNNIITAYPTTKVYGALDIETMDKIKGNSGYYIPWISDYQNCQGYWLTVYNPTNSSTCPYVTHFANSSGATNYFNSITFGICPVVILPQDVQIEKNANGVWEVVIPSTNNN